MASYELASKFPRPPRAPRSRPARRRRSRRERGAGRVLLVGRQNRVEGRQASRSTREIVVENPLRRLINPSRSKKPMNTWINRCLDPKGELLASSSRYRKNWQNS